MNNLEIQEDLVLIGIEVRTFPDKIKEAFDQLADELGSDRDFYGVSWMNDDDSVRYYAMARQLYPGEGDKPGYEKFVVEEGPYRSETILDWMKKTHLVKDVFHRLLEGSRPDGNNPCIEWYRSDDEMICLLKANG